jgi:hydroxyethylthiazole kinase
MIMSFDTTLAQRAAYNLRMVRENKPLIHNITNFVVMNYTANVLLAVGASPVMSHAPEEVEDMVSLAGALVLNIGTLTHDWIQSMIKAGKKANQLNIPIILDPVGSGATRLRTESVRRLINELFINVIRGNASEILSIDVSESHTKGVDSIHGVDEVSDIAIVLSKKLGITLVITGEVDFVTNGERVLRIHNGHPMMGKITGSGCAATSVIGSFLAVEKDPVIAAATALAYYGIAGEMAAKEAHGPGSFISASIDALYNIDEDILVSGAKIQS